MDVVLAAHILAGALGLSSGFVALYAPKGARLHRRVGMVFVCTMLAMCFIGMAIAIGRNRVPALNVAAGLITAYLVVTSLTTVRPPATGGRALHIGAMLVALTVGIFELTLGIQALVTGRPQHGMPAFPFFLFGVVGVLSAYGDFRIFRSGALQGARRLTRHLWRMCFALFIAAMSFFFGQARVIPEPLRHPAMLALPVLAVLITMLYWLWRVRVRRSLRGMAGLTSPA